MHGLSIDDAECLTAMPVEAVDCFIELACRRLQASGAFVFYSEPASVPGRATPERSFGTQDKTLTALQRSFCLQVMASNDALTKYLPLEGHTSDHSPDKNDGVFAALLGVPLRGTSGSASGALCVFDNRPRPWTSEDIRLLQDLATEVPMTVAIEDAPPAEENSADVDANRLATVGNTLSGLIFERRKTGPTSWSYQFFGNARQELLREEHFSGNGEALGFVWPDDRDHVQRALRIATRDETDVDLTFRISAPGGAIRWLRSHSVVRHEPDGNAVWEGMCFDITDLVTAREAAEAARVANNTLLVDVNHELRSPLQSILGFAELLKTEMRPDVVRGHAAIIQSSAQSLLSIVNQLLDLASGEENAARVVDRQPTELRALAGRCHGMVAPLARDKGIGSSLLIDPDVPRSVLADGPKIQQVLVNLLNNAIKFTDEGSIKLHLSRSHDGIRFSVSDTGIGIANDKIDLLFQRFFRLEPSQRSTRGSGLGLAIAKQLVEAMDGRIGVSSTPAQGTTFWVEIGAEIVQDAREPARSKELEPAGARVLVADDLDLNRKLIADMLSVDGYEVDCVNDGAAAVHAASDHSYDLILMDMIMPGVDGIAATRMIRALPAPACDVPIVALTAHSFKEQLESCLAAGMNATLTKPMSLETLTAAVRNWTQKRSHAA